MIHPCVNPDFGSVVSNRESWDLKSHVNVPMWWAMKSTTSAFHDSQPYDKAMAEIRSHQYPFFHNPPTAALLETKGEGATRTK